MKRFKKPLIILAILTAAFTVFAIVYKATYSMREASPFEVNEDSLETRLLIATQGSDFKNELVHLLVDSIRDHPVYIEVRDISVLPDVQVSDWSAILVIHTWEYSKPPREVRAFAATLDKGSPVLFFTTTGGGVSNMKGVDGISGASRPNRTASYLQLLLDKLKPLLFDTVDQNHIVH